MSVMTRHFHYDVWFGLNVLVDEVEVVCIWAIRRQVVAVNRSKVLIVSSYCVCSYSWDTCWTSASTDKQGWLDIESIITDVMTMWLYLGDDSLISTIAHTPVKCDATIYPSIRDISGPLEDNSQYAKNISPDLSQLIAMTSSQEHWYLR